MIFLAALVAGLSLGAASAEPVDPMVSPDGAHIAWVEGSTWQIWEAGVDGSAAHVVATAPTAEGISSVAWTPNGFVVDSNFTLFLGRTRLSPAGFSFAVGGARVASGPERGPGPIVVTNVHTRAQVRMGLPGVNNSAAALSPDGKRVAWTAGGAVWIAPVGGTPRRLAAKAACPSWSPDGRSIAFLRHADLRVMPAGGGRSRLLVPRAGGCNQVAWSPDSGSIAYAGASRLLTVSVPGGSVRRTPTALGRVAGGFAWSHDGSALYVTARPLADEQAQGNCTNLWRLDATSLAGAPILRGCP